MKVFCIGRWALLSATLLSACSDTQYSDLKQPKPILEADLDVKRPDQGLKKPANACDLPWGGFILDGESVDAFSASALPCSEYCSANRQVRRCEKGVLQGSAQFEFSACREEGCPSCEYTQPGGDRAFVVPHGESMTFFSAASVACGETCEPLATELSCDRGSLRADNGDGVNEYPFGSCQPARCGCQAPNPNNPDEMLNYDHGTELEFFDRAMITCGSCMDHREIRRCENGVWGGTAGFTHRACMELPCADCPMPRNPDVIMPHGTIQGFFLAQQPVCSTGCTETNRLCYNGTWERGPLPDGSRKEQYTYENCNCECEIPGSTVKVPNGTQILRYTEESIPCLADQAAYEVRIACTSGALTSTRSSDGAPVDIAGFNNWFMSPPSREPCQCDTPWGDRILQDRIFEAFPRATGNCVTPCGNPDRFVCRRVGNEMQIHSVGGGPAWDELYYQSGTCQMQDCTCTTPWGDVILEGSGPFNAFSREQGICSDNCRSAQFECRLQGGQVRIRPTLANPDADIANFPFEACQTADCRCTTPWGARVSQNAFFTAFDLSTGSCADRCESASFQCSLLGDTPTIIQPNPDGPAWDPNVWARETCQNETCTCETPWGEYEENQFFYAFTQNQGNCQSTCASARHQYQCVRETGGTMRINPIGGAPAWNPDTLFGQCQMSDCYCEAPWGAQILLNSEFPAYSQTVGTCSDSCPAPAFFKCHLNTDNELEIIPTPANPDAEIEDYPYERCNPQDCRCQTPWGAYVNPGTEFMAFNRSTGNCTDFCESGEFECRIEGGTPTILPTSQNPDLDIANFQFSSCNQTSCTCETPWGPVSEGVFRAWTIDQGTCQVSCNDSDAYFRCRRQGSQMVIVPVTGEPWDPGVYRFPSCENRSGSDCRCTTPWGEVYSDGQTGRAYSATEVACGLSCVDISKDIICEVGDIPELLVLPELIPLDPMAYPHGYCIPLSDCAGSGGGDGGGEGDDFGRGRYDDGDGGGGGGGGPGGGCEPVDFVPNPNDLVGTPFVSVPRAANNCRLPWPSTTPPGIPASFGLGGTIANGVSVAAFKKEIVECNESCEEHRVSLFCGYDGELYKPSGTLYPTCRKREDCP